MYQVQAVMSKRVVCVRESDPLDHAATLLVENHVSGLPVVNELGMLSGVITEFDLLPLVYHPDMGVHPVSQHMSPDVQYVSPTTPLCDVTDYFLTHPVRRLPVVENGHVVGIVARHDVIRFVKSLRAARRRSRTETVLSEGI